MTDLLEKFLTHYGASLKETSAGAYEFALTSPFRYFRERNIPVEKLTTENVAAWMTWETKHRMVLEGTVRFKARLLHRLMEFAIDEKLILTNPVRFSKLPKMRKTAPDKVPFTLEEHMRVLKEALDSRYERYWWAAAEIGWYTGMRISDVSFLRKDMCNFDEGVIITRPRKTSALNKIIQVPMAKDLRACLLRNINLPENQDSVYVLPAMAFDYEHARNHQSSAFCFLCDKIGLPRHTFHSYRHGFVSRLLNKGVDPITICSLTGLTLRDLQNYVHVDLDAKRRAMGIIDEQVKATVIEL